MNIRPDDLDALAGDEVSELFGWPVGLLDQLTSIQHAAHRDEITIHEWRRQDTELRATGPAQFPSDQIDATRQAAQAAWLDHDDEDAAGKRMERLVNRLRAVTNAAPDDDELRQRLGRLDELIAEERMPAVVGQLRKAQARIYRWLVTSGSIDEQSGLPWDYLARYRWQQDPVLGQVPVFVNVARRQALAEAPEEITRPAQQVCSDARASFAPVAEFDQLALTRFPARILEAANDGDPDAIALADQTRRLWQSAEAQRFLLRETAHGWPEELREPDGSPAD
jgi:uncharacterized protein YecT (DUF1311 family)